MRRSLPQIWKFFRRIGFKRRKVHAVPGKALAPEKMKEEDDFVAGRLFPKVKEAERGKLDSFYGYRPRCQFF